MPFRLPRLPSLVLIPFCLPFLSIDKVAPAQDTPITISVTNSDDDGLVSLNESVTFTATVENRSDDPLVGNLQWKVHSIAFAPTERPKNAIRIEAGQRKTFRGELSVIAPGFADVECLITSGADTQTFSKRSRIGSSPERVTSSLTKEADFDEFWNDSLRELGAIDPEFEVVEQPDLSGEKVHVFEVTMQSLGKVRVRGWLEVPKGKGPYPVAIRFPGYGGTMKPIEKWDDMIVFSFNPRAHGNSQDEVPGNPVDYWIRGLDDERTYYYRGAYMDCVRAVDLIASRSDVDQNRIAVWGGSQGGGFAFATAALDKRIDFCAADIPFLCDWVNYFELTQWPEMDGWIEKSEERTWESTLRTLSYFDTMNLSERIKCPTVMGIGMQDAVCPPSTSFAAFNRIPGRKAYKLYNDRGHGLGTDHWNWVWDQIRGEFGLPRSMTSPGVKRPTLPHNGPTP